MGLHCVIDRSHHPGERRASASPLRDSRLPAARGAAGGFTLVEVCVSMLIIAMVSSGIFSVLLTARTNQVNSDYRQQAIVFTQHLDGVLQQYTGDTTNGLAAMCNNLCNHTTGCIPGSCEPQISGDSCGSTAWATGCQHNANALLPAWFLAAPFNGSMCYQVHGLAVGTWTMPQVNTMVVWESTTSCAAP